MSPKVTVLMAVNRHDNFLESALTSVLRQSFSDFEFIIVANECDDDLWGYLEKYVDPRIRLFRLTLGGLANALNFGINEARGKYIARMDADDVSSLERLKIQYEYLERNPEVALVGCDSRLIDEEGRILTQRFKFYENDAEIRKALPIRNPILHPAIMVRRSVLLRLGGYKYGHMSEDHELFIRMARDKGNKFHNISEVLFYYRRHKNQITDISRSRRNFCEISGFLMTEFLLTGGVKYLLGMGVVSPLGRRLLQFGRHFRKVLRSSSNSL